MFDWSLVGQSLPLRLHVARVLVGASLCTDCSPKGVRQKCLTGAWSVRVCLSVFGPSFWRAIMLEPCVGQADCFLHSAYALFETVFAQASVRLSETTVDPNGCPVFHFLVRRCCVSLKRFMGYRPVGAHRSQLYAPDEVLDRTAPGLHTR